MRYFAIKGELKVVGIFECGKCGRTMTGGTETVEVDAVFEEQVAQRLANYQPKNFPVGWAAYGIGTYRCDKCKS